MAAEHTAARADLERVKQEIAAQREKHEADLKQAQAKEADEMIKRDAQRR